jgi:energy-coupling factor transporter transmembrane protein EcfT
MKKKIGVALIIVALLFATNPFGFLPAIAVYLIGILLIWYSKTSKKWQLSLTIFPLMMWFPLFYFSMYLTPIIGTALAQKIEFRFNEDFRGRVTVVSPVEWGQKVTIENEREIINVPQDGIVYYQGNIDDGYTNWKYVIISESRHIRSVEEFRTWGMTDSERELIKSDSLGIIKGGGWATTSNQPKPMVDYNLRFLWLNEWNKIIEEIDDKDSLTTTIENELRKNKIGQKNKHR